MTPARWWRLPGQRSDRPALSVLHHASITFAIIVLSPRAEPPWIVATHRFLEVAIGILVALSVVALWPEKDDAPERAPE